MFLNKNEIELGDTLSPDNNVDKQVAGNGYCKVESGVLCVVCCIPEAMFSDRHPDSSQRQFLQTPQNAPRTGIIVPQYSRDATSTTEPVAEAKVPHNPPRSGIIVPRYFSNTVAITEPALEAEVPSTDVATLKIEQLCTFLYTIRRRSYNSR